MCGCSVFLDSGTSQQDLEGSDAGADSSTDALVRPCEVDFADYQTCEVPAIAPPTVCCVDTPTAEDMSCRQVCEDMGYGCGTAREVNGTCGTDTGTIVDCDTVAVGVIHTCSCDSALPMSSESDAR